MIGQVVVDRARGHGPRPGERERGERVRVLERGDLGDHPADAEARQVRRAVVERAGERRGVRGEIAQRVRRRLGIDGGRRAGVAQVVAHDVAPAARERRAEGVGPGEHGRAAREQAERRRRVAEGLDPERDAVGLDRRHATGVGVRSGSTVGCIGRMMTIASTGSAGAETRTVISAIAPPAPKPSRLSA